MADGIEFKSNIGEVIAKLERLGVNVDPACELGMVKGLRYVEGDIVKHQFTGRPGLNRISGTAAGSWNVRTSGSGRETFAAVLSTPPRAWYVVVHQHAQGFGGWIYPKQKPRLAWRTGRTRKGPWVVLPKGQGVYIPKRLHVPEEFSSTPEVERVRQAIAVEIVKLARKVHAV